MRPIAHARRLSSRPTSSDIRLTTPLLSATWCRSAFPPCSLATSSRVVVQRSRFRAAARTGTKYAGAEGHGYWWDHLIAQRLGRFVLWRVVPVALWERLSDVRAGSPLLIEELLTLMQPGISPALEPHLPSGVVARGCQGACSAAARSSCSILATACDCARVGLKT